MNGSQKQEQSRELRIAKRLISIVLSVNNEIKFVELFSVILTVILTTGGGGGDVY
jgi:hypothetical protein